MVRASGLGKKVNFKVFVKGTIVNEMQGTIVNS